MNADTAPRRNASVSLRRALAILEFVRCRPPGSGGATLTELADAVGINKSSVLRLTAPLVEARLLDRDSGAGRFRLGPAALSLWQAYLDQMDLRSVASDHLRGLMRRTGHTCHLVLPDGHDVVYADKVENTTIVRMASRIGARMPAYRTAVGKAILAFSPPDLVADVLADGLPSVTEHTITDPAVFHEELRRVRVRGYAIDDRENEPEVRCVAAPVFDHGRDPIAAISVSSLVSRLPVARVREMGPQVAEVAARISAELGAPPSGEESGRPGP
ncbi:DNA-binding IclR family transcriptional regulator [Spinactinospora alkalitolerans]|uniref:DNA-binding IclR family transcriptional regulator n=1 Tax=Spinactinospora alkalitolerans TaxID=687207 RepID=A0A852TUT8_9ACTN|nr:IclR family transcriptional regulator [Spinactinospora alkalitolerans]NYE47799.1 DNA-binding IclR family transcriptional regulator [Spinactinospora alkalitolerans]